MSYSSLQFSKHALILVLIVCISFSVLFTRKAHATLPVIDGASTALQGSDLALSSSQTSSAVLQQIKEFALDTIAFTIAQTLSQRLTQKLTSWANSGFDGNPFYIDDAGQTFQNIAQESYKLTVSDAQRSNSPFIRTIVQKTDGVNDLISQGVTLDDFLGENWEDSFTDFSVGGWAAQTAIGEPQNNIFGTSLLLEQQVKGLTSVEAEAQKVELQSSGFIPKKSCLQTNIEVYYKDKWVIITQLNFAGEGKDFKASDYPETNVESLTAKYTENDIDSITEGVTKSVPIKCIVNTTDTPAEVIQNQVSAAVGEPLARTKLPKEFSELIAGTFSQLVTTFVDAGLRELTSTNANQSSFSQPAGPEDEFGDDWTSAPFVTINLLAELDGVYELGPNGNPVGDPIRPGAITLAEEELSIIQEMFTNEEYGITRLQQLFVELDNCAPGPDGPGDDWRSRLESQLEKEKSYKKAMKKSMKDNDNGEEFANALASLEAELATLYPEIELQRRTAGETIPAQRAINSLLDQFDILKNMQNRLVTERSAVSQSLGNMIDIKSDYENPATTEQEKRDLRYRFSQIKQLPTEGTVAQRRNELTGLKAILNETLELKSTCEQQVAEKKQIDPVWGIKYDTKTLFCIADELNAAFNNEAPNSGDNLSLECSDYYDATLFDYVSLR
jgi:hypothetical protein